MDPHDIRITCEEITHGECPVLLPSRVQKVVHLVRHGQGTHNLFAMTRHKEGTLCLCGQGLPGCPYVNEEHTDARLTQRGRLQASSAGARLRQTSPPPQVIFVSPLWRTLQTCTIAMSQHSDLQVPIIAEESIRERNGIHVCDKRSPVHLAKPHFQMVDFKRIQPGPDLLFDQVRETPEQVAARGKKFFSTLQHRPEDSIAVFTHSSFLFNTLSRSLDTPDPNTARRFQTGECRTVVLTYD